MALTDKFEDLGPNSGLVEEMYRQFLENPGSVSVSWRDFFADYAPRSSSPTPTAVITPPAPAPASAPVTAPMPAAKVAPPAAGGAR